MIKRFVTLGALTPLLILLIIWAHGNAQRVERRTDQTVCTIRNAC
ncbi:hypothetical protein [Actinoplanes sp. NPDC051494]